MYFSRKAAFLAIVCLTVYWPDSASAQNPKPANPQKVSLKDSLDGAVDLSDFLISAHGFLVIPTIITEPALGGFGGAVVPVFMKPLPPVIDSINGTRRVIGQAPNLTGGIGMYTANDSWMVGGFRSATFQKSRIKYRVFSAYGDMNLSYYRTIPNVGEKEFKLNMKMVPLYLQALKQFNNIRWSAGMQYLFLHNSVASDGDLSELVSSKEVKSNLSQIGGVLQFDGRDNIFTPDKGIHAELDFYWSDNIIGSDYDSWVINYTTIGFTPLAKKLIGGIRIDGAQTLGDPPFFIKPYLSMRGVPVMRYQGNATLLAEGELRWDAYRRWSAVFFAGTGAAYDEWDEMFDEPLVYNVGGGFRYLLARKFKLRMGIDVARGPEEWGYYIVFGSNWFR